MNIRDLRYLVAVADLQHFGKAAEQCHVSQPTLSGQIKKLEEQLGITLFERNNRRVMPTDIAQDIITSARRILLEVEQMEDIAHSARDPLGGTFRLGAFPTLSTYLFPTLVEMIKSTMPRLRLMLVEEKTEQLIEKLKIGQLDAALLALPIHDDATLSHKLFDDAFYLAAPANHPLCEHQTIDQSMLAQHRLLLLEEGHCLRDQALDICHLHNIKEEHDFRATGLETLRQMVKAGTGITFMPEIAIGHKDEGIRYIPFTPPAPTRTIGLVWRKTFSRRQIIETLIENIKKPDTA